MADVPEPQIPLAYLPGLADTAGFFTMSFGSAGLLLLLGLDVWGSKTRKNNWIRGESFVLGALTLQFVGFLYRPLVSIANTHKLDPAVVSQLSDTIYNYQLLIIGQRVVMCVFIGILLPVVAGTSRLNLWSDISALAIQAAGVLVHISYDIYIIVIDNWIEGFYWDYWTAWLLASNILVFLSLGLLVLLLGCAALASASVQQIVARKITVLLPGNLSEAPSFEAFIEQAVRSWIAQRTCQPQYIIARSVLISSTGFLVTLCVLVSILASFEHAYIPLEDINDGFRLIALILQWIFISFGYVIVCWIWITAVVYYPRPMENWRCSGLKAYFRVEDFWKRALLELQDEFVEWNVESIEKLSYLNRFMFTAVHGLQLYKPLLPLLICLQILVVRISKTCWLISEMVFSHHIIRRLIMGKEASRDFLALYYPHIRGPVIPNVVGDFARYSTSLMQMPGQNPAGIWIANQKSVAALRTRLNEAKTTGQNCTALISLLQKRSMEVSKSTVPSMEIEGDINLAKSSPKMRAVSLLTIIMGLSEFYRPANGSSHVGTSSSTNTSTITVDGANGSSHVGTSSNTSTITVKECIEACNEAWKIMELVEIMDKEAALVNKEADKVFHSLKQSNEWLGIALPSNSSEDRSVGAINRSLQELKSMGERMERMETGRDLNSVQHDSRNWKEVDAGSSLQKLCEFIESRSNDTEETLNFEETLNLIQRMLADVICKCMSQVNDIIKDVCKNMCIWWANEDFMEKNLLHALELAGTVRGVENGLARTVSVVSGPNTFELEGPVSAVSGP